jgi:hypothetical protein
MTAASWAAPLDPVERVFLAQILARHCARFFTARAPQAAADSHDLYQDVTA